MAGHSLALPAQWEKLQEDEAWEDGTLLAAATALGLGDEAKSASCSPPTAENKFAGRNMPLSASNA